MIVLATIKAIEEYRQGFFEIVKHKNLFKHSDGFIESSGRARFLAQVAAAWVSNPARASLKESTCSLRKVSSGMAPCHSEIAL